MSPWTVVTPEKGFAPDVELSDLEVERGVFQLSLQALDSRALELLEGFFNLPSPQSVSSIALSIDDR